VRTEDKPVVVELGAARSEGGRPAGRWADLAKTPYGIVPVLVIALVSLLQIFETQAFGIAGPDVARDLHLELGSITFLLQATLVASLFASLGIGWLADRHRRVPIFGLSVILSGVFAILTSRARSMFTLGSARVVDDAATQGTGVPVASLMADYYPVDARGRVFAALGIGTQLASVLAPIVVGGLLLTIGWRSSFAIFGAAVTIAGVVALLALREPVRGYFERRAMGADEDVARTEDEPQSFGEAWRTVWAVRTLRRLFIADIFLLAGTLPFLYFPFFLAEHYGLNAFDRGAVLAPAAVFGLAGAVVGGALVDRLVQRGGGRAITLFALFDLVAAVAILTFALAPPLWALVATTCVFYVGYAMIGPAVGAVYSLVIPPVVRTQANQMLRLSLVPAVVVFAPLIGMITAKHGFTGGFFLSVPLFVVGAIIQLTAADFFDVDRRNALRAAVAAEEWRRARREGRGKLLVCRGVDVAYDGVQVLFDVDFDVEQGEIIALLGTNGAGKSSLLRAISGTQEASNGAIVFDGRDITHMPPHEIAARGVIHMPGGRGIFPGLSVRENVLLGTWLSEDVDVPRRLAEVFELFGVLRERARAKAGDLSGGEQQMLSLAQAFLNSPRLLMIDELSLGLSPAVVAELLDVVRKIRDAGTTVIVVEQSVNVALTIARRAIFMEKGEVKFFGATADLLRRPDILRAVYVKGTGALTGAAPRARRSQELERARPVLEVSGIVKRYGGVTALDGVSFALREGEVLGLIGPNGAGKTTLFDVVSGYQAADAGTVVLDGVDVTAMEPQQRAKRRLVRRFQDAKLFGALTVVETLLVALEQRLEVRSIVLGAVQAPVARRAERRVRQRADRLIELLDLGAYRDKFVKELSTGLRRIVDLACVLATDPKVLLLDEPSSGIAQAEAEALAPLLGRVRYETGCSMLVIEHDMPLVSAVADELLAMDQGRIVVRGTPEAVLTDDRVIEAYLGTTEATIRRTT
jgi:branched-chain amino acid transport system ATP-binding protein